MKKISGNSIRGHLIVFEGVDRVGKSTQIKLLKQHFDNELKEKCEILAFPNRDTKIGAEINEILRNYKHCHQKSIHLMFSFNRWEKREDILSILESGSHLIIDRYAFSGVAYSSASGVDPNWCLYPDQGLPRPDIVFQLDIDTEKLTTRENYGEEVYEKLDFQQKVRNEYKRFENYKYWNVINADDDKENVHKNIVEKLDELRKKLNNEPYGTFDKNFYPNSIGEDLFMYKDV